MKTLFTVCLLCIAAGACDDLPVFPLQRRAQPGLGELAQAPLWTFTTGNTMMVDWSTVTLFEVPAHYECSKPGYGVVWEKTERGYNVNCKKVQP